MTATQRKKIFDEMSEAEYEKYRHGFDCPSCEDPMVERKK